ncbi:hypothetical protein Tco_1043183 [Tanacetum coccineum]|uniref:Uncharacterized protein n=1 Tax=Tanacetum coccineum TaxID=301880 RepID=A0ABQ5GLP4_9ASTR
MTRSSTESKTSLAIAANLSELELNKILIEKMESNKSINRSNEQKNLYKALVKAYESDKLILDTYSDIVSFKRRKDDEDKDEEPSAGSNWGSKRRRAGKEPESTSALKEKTSKTTDRSKSQHKSAGKSAHTEEPMHPDKDLEEPAHHEFDIRATEEQSDKETSQHPDWFQKPAKIPSPDRDWNKTLPAAHGPIQPWLSTLAQMEDPRESINELMDTPLDFSTFMMNRLKVDTLTLKLLAGPTFELMKGSCKSLVELKYLFEEVYKATTDQLDWYNPEGMMTSYTSSKKAISIGFTYKLSKRVDDLQLGVESYQKKLNLTKPDTYIQDLKRRDAYTAYSNPRGFIYQNKDKKNRLMRIDELHKFSDHSLDDVRSALNDLLKGIRMQYLPQTIWKQCDKDNARAMIHIKVKEFKRSFRHSHTERLSRSDKVLKLKNFKKDAILKLFESTNQERYEHVGPEVTSSQDGQGKKERVKSIALKTKKESSDDETSTSESDDEEYAMAKLFKCGDPNHLIGDSPKPPRNKDQKAFVGGCWSDSKNEADDKTSNETCLMAQSSNEVTLGSSHHSDNASSLDNDSMQNEYDNLC